MTTETTDKASEDTTRTKLIELLAATESPTASYSLSLALNSASSDEHRELMLRKLYIDMREALNGGDIESAATLSLIVQRLVQLKAFA